MLHKKERKRFSLSRQFAGDYLSYLDDPILKSLFGKNERAWFASSVTKYDRNFKPSLREIIVTDNSIFIIGAEKEKSGPNKGKLVKVVKRQIQFANINSLSLSTKCDDIFVIHTPNDYDSVLETVLKTELVTVVSEKYQLKLGRSLVINFKDDIEYSVKKTTWQAAGQYEIHFVNDSSKSSAEIISSGKSATVRVPSGLPKDSRPINRKNSIHGISKQVKNQGNRNLGYQSAPINNSVTNRMPSITNIAAPIVNNCSNNSLGSQSSLAQDAARQLQFLYLHLLEGHNLLDIIQEYLL